MKNRKLLSVAITLGIVFFGLSIQAAGLKKWQDKDGNWHFGDTIPPEFAQQGHQEISKQGLVIETKERAKTDAEIEEEKQLAAIEKKKQKLAEEQARLDRMLLDTFSNVDDIENARDSKIEAITSRISLINRRSEKIKVDLDNRIQQAAAEERSGKNPNEGLLKDIESLRRQLKNNELAIKESDKDKEEVRAAYQSDIDRFNKLKTEGL